MIHVASLLHDDVINASALSRGVPSAPAAFGNKLAQHRPLVPRQHSYHGRHQTSSFLQMKDVHCAVPPTGKCRLNVVLCAVCVRASCVC
ncbi:hypothetical protein K438DRAFT_1841006 [Mycena galopus ATCC 62051]|nr:hypothetical protein K438DRAFT_1841006 [Mycena galopus ATCC 62051]